MGGTTNMGGTTKRRRRDQHLRDRHGSGCQIITIRRPFLVGAWLKDALEEHASVAAFARFTLHLLSLGAPPALVLGSQRASLDEIQRAKACFGLACRYGREPLGPAGLAVGDAVRELSLEEVARLTAQEGCVGETLGAVLAREQLSVSRDSSVIAALKKIAVDEARHAELAWSFVRWAVLAGGVAVREAIMEGVEHAIAGTLSMEVASYDGIDLEALHAHGRLTCAESRRVARKAIEEVVRPCLRALFSGLRVESYPMSVGVHESSVRDAAQR